MQFTLQDAFFATGIVMFVLMSVTVIFVLVALVRLRVKIQSFIDTTNQFINETRRTHYSVQYGIFQLILKLIGGDKHYER